MHGSVFRTLFADCHSTVTRADDRFAVPERLGHRTSSFVGREHVWIRVDTDSIDQVCAFHSESFELQPKTTSELNPDVTVDVADGDDIGTGLVDPREQFNLAHGGHPRVSRDFVSCRYLDLNKRLHCNL